MFVRWKRRQRIRQQKATGEWLKAAVLVQSIRTQAGPRQKHVCYLGSIDEQHEKDTMIQILFWEDVERNLDRARIRGEERQKIVSALESVIRLPSREDEAKLSRKFSEMVYRLRNLNPTKRR